MKHSLIIFIVNLVLLSAGSKLAYSQPKWFNEFSDGFLRLNAEYLEKTEDNKQVRDRYNFKPKKKYLTRGNKMSISVKGLDHVYLSFERGNELINRGILYNPCLIDEKGVRHPVIFRQENVFAGNIRSVKNKNNIEVRFNKCVIKLPLNGKYSHFEADYPKQEAHLLVDVVSDMEHKRKTFEDWETLHRELFRKYPEIQGKNGIAREINCGLEEWIIRRSEDNMLTAFYLEHSNDRFTRNWNKKAVKNISNVDLYDLRKVFVKSKEITEAISRIERQQTEPIVMAIKDCLEEHPNDFKNADEYLNVVEKYKQEKDDIIKGLEDGDTIALNKAEKYFTSIDEALLANPLLDFDEIMLIKRDANRSRKRMPGLFGFPSLNSHNNTRIPEIEGEWHNTISKLSDLRGEKKIETVVDAKHKKLITDLELDFNRDHILFSMENDSDVWHVYETDITGDNFLCVTPDSLPDVNHFDACYLPNGNVVYTSDATYQGLPCENGSRPMSLLYVIDREKGKIRQLTYEQDSDFSPAVLNNGRLLYLRWEYSDLAHYFSRILMSCNPDGTAQMEYYGSNSYFPNTYIYARPLPNHQTKVIGIVGGHHGITRSGRLIIADPSVGRSEADGMVHEIPHRGRKVEPIIKDHLVAGVWPQFLHPYPLNDKYFLVSAKLDENSLWGIYLVDVFDNMTLIREVEGSGLFDPIPVRKEPTPPIIPERIVEGSKDANVFITDIYIGDGLKDIPRGTVKSLRLFAYHYGHITTGGHASVGVESSWDIKRILGTVPVEEDGSAMFKIPANTPISIQPLDSAGRALQLMRSWFVGMPGENVSCIGCHERTSQVPPNMFRMASRRAPSEIEPWQGNPRPFSFRYEVQPVLDKYCVSCHNGERESIPDFRKADFVDLEGKQTAEYFFEDKAYMALHPYVRRPGPETDLHMLKPMEYHASTSELVQLLQRGHHGVEIEQEDWEKLYTWIDLNAPHRGKWSPPEFRNFDQDERRKCLSERYANITVDPEAEYDSLVTYMENLVVEPVEPVRKKRVKYEVPNLDYWPLSSKQSKKKQFSLVKRIDEIDLGNGQTITLAGIPEGEFIKGNRKGYANERKPEVVKIDSPFFMSEYEITNAQYALFDSLHDSRFIDQQWKDHTTPGYPANEPNQPVIRVSYNEAVAFCKWLSKKTGRKVSLPTENQWEWACRAGTDTDFWFESDGSDFGQFENLSDYNVRQFAVQGVNPSFIGDDHPKLPQYAFIPRDNNVDDGNMVVSQVGSYKPNTWGLYDMHGNVAEWTKTSYQPTGEIQDKFYNEEMKVVKGGSWRDRPKKAKAGSKRYYMPHQKVYNVGFRVVIE